MPPVQNRTSKQLPSGLHELREAELFGLRGRLLGLLMETSTRSEQGEKR